MYIYIYMCLLLLNYSVPSTYQYSVYIQNHPDAPRIMIEIVIFQVRNGETPILVTQITSNLLMELENLQSKSNEANNSEAIWITLQAKPDSNHASYWLPPRVCPFATATRVAGSNEKHTQGHSHTHGLSTGFMRIRTKGFEHLISDRIWRGIWRLFF